MPTGINSMHHQAMNSTASVRRDQPPGCTPGPASLVLLAASTTAAPPKIEDYQPLRLYENALSRMSIPSQGFRSFPSGRTIHQTSACVGRRHWPLPDRFLGRQVISVRRLLVAVSKHASRARRNGNTAHVSRRTSRQKVGLSWPLRPCDKASG